MTGVEEEVLIGGRTDNRRAVRRFRAQSGPEFGFIRIAASGKQLQCQIQDMAGAGLVDGRVVTGQFRRSGHPQAVAEAAEDQFVLVVNKADSRSFPRVFNGQGHGITLGRVNRQGDP